MMNTRSSRRQALAKRYFALPNEIFSLGLKGGAILVYAYLMYCEDRRTYQCYPSYRTIGNAVGMSKNTVRKFVAQLVEHRLIDTEPTSVITRAGIKRNGTLLYTILPISVAVTYHHEQQMLRAQHEKDKQEIRVKLAEYDRDESDIAV